MGVGEILDEWIGLAHGVHPPPRSTSTCSKKQRQAPPAAGPAARSCWISTGPSPSSATPRRRPRSCPNLMIGFGIDEVQAEFVAEIKPAQHQPRVYPQSARTRPTQLAKEIADARGRFWTSKREVQRHHHRASCEDDHQASTAAPRRTRHRLQRRSWRSMPSRGPYRRITRCICSSRGRAISRRSRRSRCA